MKIGDRVEVRWESPDWVFRTRLGVVQEQTERGTVVVVLDEPAIWLGSRYGLTDRETRYLPLTDDLFVVIE